jgi:hypothetical protein
MIAIAASAIGAVTVLVCVPNRLYASFFELGRETQLMVYRSPVVKDRHDIYRPVAVVVGEAQPIAEIVLEDEWMFFGKATLSIYSLGNDLVMQGVA